MRWYLTGRLREIKRKILAVDDSAINREILKKLLSDEYCVLSAASGEEALEILDLEHRTISAVLLDITLPGIDGYGVLSSIRSDSRFSDMPVIMITASDDEKTRVKSLALSANDFVMKPYSREILKHSLENYIALHEASKSCAEHGVEIVRKPPRKPSLSFKSLAILLCVVSLVISICCLHFSFRRELQKTSENVTVDFTDIMNSYQNSFRMFELLLQQEIKNAAGPDEIETFLKEQDKRLLAIEGSDYDGVYMYYQGRYLYSWDTPYSVYSESGYDATKRPWYIGAVEANGGIFFSTPYPSYANDYMLATISRLQEDGETVIAYDIKLGQIGQFVDRLNLRAGTLALICDNEGNIIGSTNRLYQGGNYTFTSVQLAELVARARAEAEKAGEQDESAAMAVKSAEALQRFVTKESRFLYDLLAHQETLRYSLSTFSLGYAYANDTCTCFVVTPIASILPQIAILWAALLFASLLLAFLIDKMLRRNTQILTDVLTGLNNRRAFLKYCDNHMQHHEDEPLGLLMMDLDHFKSINDLYGHAAGDQALLDAATVLKSACGQSSDNYFLCRYGGDEFLLAARIEDLPTLENMKTIIKNDFKRKNQVSMTPYALEASMGAAFGVCKNKKDVENLLAIADQAMYDEKRKLGQQDSRL